MDVLEPFIHACEQGDEFPCLIIDEASTALAASTPKQRASTMDALRALTRFSKQEQRMNVLLAASEHDESFRLHDLGFKSNQWTAAIIVGEVRVVPVLGARLRCNTDSVLH